MSTYEERDQETREEAYERGYDKGFAHAEDYWRAKEQERIIELLKELDDYDWVEIHTAELIALIKGKNK